MKKTCCDEHPRFQRGCEACRDRAKLNSRRLRAHHRGIDEFPEPVLTVIEGVEPDHVAVAAPGRVEAAVQADLDALGLSAGSLALAAAALVLARDLDDRWLATSHASMAKVLASLMATLPREAAPKRGRLAVVQEMTQRA